MCVKITNKKDEVGKYQYVTLLETMYNVCYIVYSVKCKMYSV